MQNFGRFFATSDFDCEYLQNGLRYPNLKANFPDRFLLRSRKQIPWTLAHKQKKVIGANIDPHKWTFLRDYILALRGCCPLKILHASYIDLGYSAHTPREVGVPQKIYRKNLKFALKFRVLALGYNFGASGSILAKLSYTTCREVRVIKRL